MSDRIYFFIPIESNDWLVIEWDEKGIVVVVKTRA
jgi:hypothetical protein